MRDFALVMCMLAVSATAHAQERSLSRADLPRGVEARLTAIIENPATQKIVGETTIAEPQSGDVVVYNGPLTLSSKIEGALIMIDGSVVFNDGAAVTGDITVIGGHAHNLENATIGGTITFYEEGFSLFRRGERVLSVDSRTRRVYRENDHDYWGRGAFAVRTDWNYNRVEGLPIQFGPILESRGRNPFRVEALAIWRTEAGSPFDAEDWGYNIRAEQFLGGNRTFRVGGAFRSVIEPIENWQVTRSEASLATFLLHDDLHDYFQREGWSAYARYAPRASGLSATLAYNDETHHAQPARDPWTLFSNGDEWRLQPLVAEGNFQSLSAQLQLDRRNDADFPSAGFLVRGELVQGLGGSLAVPATLIADTDVPLDNARPFDVTVTTALIDARIYQRISPQGTLSFRGALGGALKDRSLPPQLQHALGGVGSLPGYSLFSADCGARRVAVGTSENNARFFPYYGCDRMALFSAEYRGGFNMHFGGVEFWNDHGEDDDWGWHLDANPNWVVFFDAGKGWASSASRSLGATDTPNLYDVGAGILLGDVGLYGAVPLSGTDRKLKIFLRLGPRF